MQSKKVVVDSQTIFNLHLNASGMTSSFHSVNFFPFEQTNVIRMESKGMEELKMCRLTAGHTWVSMISDIKLFHELIVFSPNFS